MTGWTPQSDQWPIYLQFCRTFVDTRGTHALLQTSEKSRNLSNRCQRRINTAGQRTTPRSDRSTARICPSSHIPLQRRRCPHRAFSALIVMNSTFGLRTRRPHRIIDNHRITLLRPPIYMKIIPSLRQLRAAIIRRSLSLGSLIVSLARAANVRFRAEFCV